ncbi:MAG TPA: hypothetical protein V6D19_13025 [Stenomitos sp.]
MRQYPLWYPIGINRKKIPPKGTGDWHARGYHGCCHTSNSHKLNMKKIIIIVAVLSAIGAGVYFYGNESIEFTSTVVPEAIAKTESRTDTVKNLIDELQAKREQDPTFKAETKKMEDELEAMITKMRKDLVEHRKAQSRLDALVIVQTQYDMEISDLEEANQLVVNK